MGKINLLEIIGDAQTLVDVFNKLKGMEVTIEKDLHSSYISVEARKEFVIFEDIGSSKGQLLHPYGTDIGYYVYEFIHTKGTLSR